MAASKRKPPSRSRARKPAEAKPTSDDQRESARRGLDRRAFWRPTPDRRREATGQGRRDADK